MSTVARLTGFECWLMQHRRSVQTFWVAVGLVSLPVFFQAPLVRAFPFFSLILTGFWLFLGILLNRKSRWELWGDLLIGFSWSWLAGTLYWGWLRWEPMLHLPVEAVGLPIVAVCLTRNWSRVGSYFYLGSLLGTAITDLYINWMGLFPAWRQLMNVESDLVPIVLRSAAESLQTDLAACRAMVLMLLLLLAGCIPLLTQSPRLLSWWAFSGAVLSTLIVDGLFFLSAYFA